MSYRRRLDPAHNTQLRSLLYVVAAAAGGLLVIGTITILVMTYGLTAAVRETQLAGQQRGELTRNAAEAAEAAAQDAARSADRVEECTTPGGRCFDDNQQRLSRTVGTINRYALAAAACADQPEQQTIDEIQECIVLAIRGGNRKPQEKP